MSAGHKCLSNYKVTGYCNAQTNFTLHIIYVSCAAKPKLVKMQNATAPVNPSPEHKSHQINIIASCEKL